MPQPVARYSVPVVLSGIFAEQILTLYMTVLSLTFQSAPVAILMTVTG